MVSALLIRKDEVEVSRTEIKSAAEYQHYLKHGHFPNEAKPSKFGNHKVDWGGMIFDSKLEWERYLELLALQEDGRIAYFKRQVPIVLQPEFTRYGESVKAIRYIADFTYSEYDVEDGQWHRVIEDAKGHQTTVFRLKWKMLKWLYRDDDVRLKLTFRKSKGNQNNDGANHNASLNQDG